LFLSEKVDEKELQFAQIHTHGDLSKVFPHDDLDAAVHIGQQEKQQYGGHYQVGLFDSTRRPYGVKVRVRPVYRAAVENQQSNAYENTDYCDGNDFECFRSVELARKTSPVVERGEISAQDHHGLAGVGSAGAPGRAVTAVIAQPRFGRSQDFISLPQLNVPYQFSRKGVLRG